MQLSCLSNAAGVSFDTTQLAHWTSSDPTVASIGDVIGHKALLTGINPGTFVSSVTATLLDSGLTATISITVHEISLTGLAIDSTSFRFVPGEKSTLEVRGTFDNGKTFSVAPDMTWTSDNAAIAVVSHGVLHALSIATTWPP